MKTRFVFVSLLIAAQHLWGYDADSLTQAARLALKKQYDYSCETPTDIYEHVPHLRRLARECSSVIEIGLNSMVSSWGIFQGLSENPSSDKTYLGIDIAHPPEDIFHLAEVLVKAHGISFEFWHADDLTIDIRPTDLLFIDSNHIYAHLTYELETFSPYARKYIAMHDTGFPFAFRDSKDYQGDRSEYPTWISREKTGMWVAVTDFLRRHPEWELYERYYNNNGFTILKRTTSL